MKKKIKLDKYEKELELHLEHCQKINNEKIMKKQLEIAAKKYLAEKKRITIEISRHDIEAVKIKASKLGIPYQTYINILIHKDTLSL
jgi:predicted DNA binding CopG/RHH family protein